MKIHNNLLNFKKLLSKMPAVCKRYVIMFMSVRSGAQTEDE